MNDFYQACKENRTAIANEVGIFPQTIDRWIRRGSINPIYRERVLQAFKKLGIKYKT